MKTVEELLDWADEKIRSSRNVDLWRKSDARVNAEEMLGHILAKELTHRHLDDEVDTATERRFRRMVARRVAGEPVALIIGKTDFRGLTLSVRRGIFIPRNSSELLAEKAIRRLRRSPTKVAVDVATGSGPVALSIAHEVKGSRVYGLDIWAPSIRVAKDNARALGLRNIHFLRSDMLQRLPKAVRGKVDVFTIHPPYVAKKYVRTLPKEIREFEPATSLSDLSTDGLGLVRRLVEDAPQWLRHRGWLMVEVSPDLSRSVAAVLRRGGFKEVKSERDSLGATRVVSGRYERT